MTGKQALVLLSGGLDSATVAAVAIDRGFKCSAITFTYGQRHRIEVKYAEELAKFFGIENHIKVDLPVQMFSSSALSDESRQSIPKNRNISADDIPVTYVPARNIIFLSFALAYAEASGIQDIFLGVNALDYSGYPDCRPEFISLFEKMANAGTKSGVGGKKIKIHAPLINLKKAEIIKMGTDLKIDYSLTHSCYDPSEDGLSCGECDSCMLRKKGFEEAQIPDPTHYKIR